MKNVNKPGKPFVTLMMLVSVIFLTVTCLTTSSYAQEPTVSESAATSTVRKETPSDSEIKKSFVRSLDKVEAQQAVIGAQKEELDAETEARQELEKANQLNKKSAEAYKSAFEKERAARQTAEDGWRHSEQRVRQLEKKFRSGNDKLKWMSVGAAVALITIFVVK